MKGNKMHLKQFFSETSKVGGTDNESTVSLEKYFWLKLLMPIKTPIITTFP